MLRGDMQGAGSSSFDAPGASDERTIFIINRIVTATATPASITIAMCPPFGRPCRSGEIVAIPTFFSASDPDPVSELMAIDWGLFIYVQIFLLTIGVVPVDNSLEILVLHYRV